MSEPGGIHGEAGKAQRVYRHLRRGIRRLRIAPGSVLDRDDIARRMGVSRAPVREAVARLAGEGLVEIHPRKGSYVAPIRRAQVRESLFVRMALEVEAARRAALRVDAALMERLEDNLARQADAVRSANMARLHRLDEALHAAIFEAVDTGWSQRMLDLIRVPLDRPLRLAFSTNNRPEETLAEHRRLVDAIGSGDPDRAGDAMRAHLGVVQTLVEREVARVTTR
jgi:DNA-binding GntR family transcriptional regulator